MNAIEIHGLEKKYLTGFWRKREKYGLKPLHLEVRDGECFGYLGPNGAGKTTTLKILMGIIYPTGGSAQILGRDYRDPAVKAEIGFLPEHPYFYDYLTARELLEYYAQLSGVPSAERAQRAQRMLERVGLKDAADTQLRKFSKGMLQRTGIAQAILHDPKLVILDEPMSGLDPIGRREVRDIIQSLKDEGKTVFFSTHILSDAETLCDRVAVLNKGELLAVGSMADLAVGDDGKVEIVFEGAQAVREITALGGECRVTGSTVRARMAATAVDQAIDCLRRQQARLTSLTPVHHSLEEFFMGRLAQAEQSRRAGTS